MSTYELNISSLQAAHYTMDADCTADHIGLNHLLNQAYVLEHPAAHLNRTYAIQLIYQPCHT